MWVGCWCRGIYAHIPRKGRGDATLGVVVADPGDMVVSWVIWAGSRGGTHRPHPLAFLPGLVLVAVCVRPRHRFRFRPCPRRLRPRRRFRPRLRHRRRW